MDCDLFEKHVWEYASGELEPSFALAMREHANVCMRCRAQLRFQADVEDALIRWGRYEDPPSTFHQSWSGAIRSLEQSSSSGETSKTRRGRRGFIKVLVALPIAAALVICAILGAELLFDVDVSGNNVEQAVLSVVATKAPQAGEAALNGGAANGRFEAASAMETPMKNETPADKAVWTTPAVSADGSLREADTLAMARDGSPQEIREVSLPVSDPKAEGNLLCSFANEHELSCRPNEAEGDSYIIEMSEATSVQWSTYLGVYSGFVWPESLVGKLKIVFVAVPSVTGIQATAQVSDFLN